MDDLDMDLKCEGRCAYKQESDWDFLIGLGDQVRWNPIVGLSLCCDCQDKWASWWASGYGLRPGWIPKDIKRPGEA
jgi:hypothetical protein